MAEKESEFEMNPEEELELDIMENATEPSQSKMEDFITQIESTDKVSEIDNLFAAMFTSSAEEDRRRISKDSDEEAAPVAGSSCTNYTTRDLAFFSSEDEEDDDKNLSRKSNSRFSSQPQPQLDFPKDLTLVVEIPERNNTFVCSVVTIDGTLLSLELSKR